MRVRYSRGLGSDIWLIRDHYRPLDPTSTCLRHPQILHLHTGPAHGCHPAKGRKNTKRLGLGYRQEKAEAAKVVMIPPPSNPVPPPNMSTRPCILYHLSNELNEPLKPCTTT